MIEQYNKTNDNINSPNSDAPNKSRATRGIVVEDDSEQPKSQAKSGCC